MRIYLSSPRLILPRRLHFLIRLIKMILSLFVMGLACWRALSARSPPPRNSGVIFIRARGSLSGVERRIGYDDGSDGPRHCHAGRSYRGQFLSGQFIRASRPISELFSSCHFRGDYLSRVLHASFMPVMQLAFERLASACRAHVGGILTCSLHSHSCGGHDRVYAFTAVRDARASRSLARWQAVR